MKKSYDACSSYDGIFYPKFNDSFVMNRRLVFMACPHSTLGKIVWEHMLITFNKNGNRLTHSDGTIYDTIVNRKLTLTTCIHVYDDQEDDASRTISFDNGDHDALLLMIGSQTEYRCIKWLFFYFLKTFFLTSPIYRRKAKQSLKWSSFWEDNCRLQNERKRMEYVYITNGIFYIDVFLECNNNLRIHPSTAEQNVVRYHYDREGKGYKLFTKYIGWSRGRSEDATEATDDATGTATEGTAATTATADEVNDEADNTRGDESWCVFDRLYWRDDKAIVRRFNSEIYEDYKSKFLDLEERVLIALLPLSPFVKCMIDVMITISCQMVNIDDQKNKQYLSFCEQFVGALNRIILIDEYVHKFWKLVVHTGCIFSLGISRKLSSDNEAKKLEDHKSRARQRAINTPGSGINVGGSGTAGDICSTPSTLKQSIKGYKLAFGIQNNGVENSSGSKTPNTNAGGNNKRKDTKRLSFLETSTYDTCMISLVYSWVIFKKLKNAFIRNMIKSSGCQNGSKKVPSRSPRTLHSDSIGFICNFFTGVITGAGKRFMFNKDVVISFGFTNPKIRVVQKFLLENLFTPFKMESWPTTYDKNNRQVRIIVLFNDKLIAHIEPPPDIVLDSEEVGKRDGKDEALLIRKRIANQTKLFDWYFNAIFRKTKETFPFVEMYFREAIYKSVCSHFLFIYTHNGTAMIKLEGRSKFEELTKGIKWKRNNHDDEEDSGGGGDDDDDYFLSRSELENCVSVYWRFHNEKAIQLATGSNIDESEGGGSRDTIFENLYPIDSFFINNPKMPDGPTSASDDETLKNSKQFTLNELRHARLDASNSLIKTVNAIIVTFWTKHFDACPKSELVSSMVYNENYSNQKKLNCGVNGVKTTSVSVKYLEITRLTNVNCVYFTQPGKEVRENLTQLQNSLLLRESAMVADQMPKFLKDNTYILRTALAAPGMYNVADAIIINEKLNLNVLVYFKTNVKFKLELKDPSILNRNGFDLVSFLNRHVQISLSKVVKSRSFDEAQSDHIPVPFTRVYAPRNGDSLLVGICDLFINKDVIKVIFETYPKYWIETYDDGRRISIFKEYNDKCLREKPGEANLLRYDVETYHVYDNNFDDTSINKRGNYYAPNQVHHRVCLEFYTTSKCTSKASTPYGTKGILIEKNFSDYFDDPTKEPDVMFNPCNIISRNCTGLFYGMRQYFGSVSQIKDNERVLVGRSPLMFLGLQLKPSTAPMKFDINTQITLFGKQLPLSYTGARVDDLDNNQAVSLPPNAGKVLKLFKPTNADVRVRINKGHIKEDERSIIVNSFQFGDQATLDEIRHIEKEYEELLKNKNNKRNHD